MPAPKTRPLELIPRPHGEPIVWECECGTREAAYPGDRPRRWIGSPRACRCPRCARKRR
jgi:hypothetical protein